MARRRVRRKQKRALALASGGVAGLLYQVGVMEALDDAAIGFGSRDFDLYLGTGSGAVLAALLAAGYSPREVAAAFEGRSAVLPAFDVKRLFVPNYREILRKPQYLPRTIWYALRDNVAEIAVQDFFVSLTGVLPSGVYVNDYLESYLKEALAPVADSFEQLEHDLFVMATDVDSGKCAVFSRTDVSDVPISRALAATSAVPMLYRPVEIGGHHFVDGTMTKSLHLSLALEMGSTFNFCVTPIHPVVKTRDDGRPPLADTGVVSVAKQALRTLLHSRLLAGLDQYTDQYPDRDILLVKPKREEGGALFYNVAKARTRRMLKEMGYLRGRDQIEEDAAMLERTGIGVVRRSAAAKAVSSGTPMKLGNILDRLEAGLDGNGHRTEGGAQGESAPPAATSAPEEVSS